MLIRSVVVPAGEAKTLSLPRSTKRFDVSLIKVLNGQVDRYVQISHGDDLLFELGTDDSSFSGYACATYAAWGLEEIEVKSGEGCDALVNFWE